MGRDAELSMSKLGFGSETVIQTGLAIILSKLVLPRVFFQLNSFGNRKFSQITLTPERLKSHEVLSTQIFSKMFFLRGDIDNFFGPFDLE